MTQDEKAKFETTLAFGIPAPAINRFTAVFYPHGVRLGFVEETPEGVPHMRAAVFMSRDDAMALAHVLHHALTQDTGLMTMSTEGVTKQ